MNSKYKIKFNNNNVILPHVDHSVTEYEMYQLCCDIKHTLLAKRSASFFSQVCVCVWALHVEFLPFSTTLFCWLTTYNCITIRKTYLHTWNTSFTTSSTCSIPSSVRSTLIPKKPNPRAPVRAPPTRLLHQPFVRSTDSKLPGPSWPNRWLR